MQQFRGNSNSVFSFVIPFISMGLNVSGVKMKGKHTISFRLNGSVISYTDKSKLNSHNVSCTNSNKVH